ncbi:hypothetical protein Dip518_000272 [Parelusimicrobium proximum]|uniref:hypothetical protein n=1 Tax=Parelusimicrobium proximum TaxID=3228953 RepID=UPI003D1679A5
MSETNKSKMRIRLRLSSGEEFEAEGDKEFILEEKESFLSFVSTPRNISKAPAYTRKRSDFTQADLFAQPASSAPEKPAAGAEALLTVPSFMRKKADSSPGLSITEEETPAMPGVENKTAQASPSSEIWAKLFKIDDGLILLRRKHRLITPSYAAIMLVSAARALAQQSACSALKLAKSMKQGGYIAEGERLDRLLAQDIKEGLIYHEGEKRGRVYKVSESGFARAYIMAEKIAREII